MTVAVLACDTCGATPCVNPNFCRACREADRQIGARREADRDFFISIGDAAMLALSKITRQ